jgi:CelD/BcsL family acetyltransferase involved in cellulose biosynthesis
MGDIEFQTLTSVEQLEPLEQEWNELVRAMRRPTPFLLHAWVRAWLRHCARDAEPTIHVAHRGGRLVAALPLVVRTRVGLQVASFVGDDHPFVDVLLAPDEGLETAGALVAHATERHDCASLFTISADSTLARIGGEDLRLIPRVRAPSIDISLGFEHVYHSKYSSKQRSSHNRGRRQLASQGEFEFKLAKTSEELAVALEHAFQLHAQRWQGRFDASGFIAPPSMDLHREASQELAAESIPRILTAYLDNRPIAFSYYFILSGRMFGYRTAFDPAYSSYSPGLLCMLAGFESAAEEGVTTIELLGGTQAWKADIADRIEQLYGGIGLSSGTRGRAYARALILRYGIRNRLADSSLAHRLYYEYAGSLLERLRFSKRERSG